MVASRPPGIARTKSGLGDTQRLPHLLFSRVGLAVLEVARDRSAEEIRALGHEPDGGPQQRRVELAHVDPSEEHSAGGDIEEPWNQVHERRLAAPVLPTIAVVVPGR